jgi:hypothetical protein
VSIPTERRVPRYEGHPAEPTRIITIQMEVPESYPDDIHTEALRVLRVGVPMLAEGTPAEVLIRKWMPRDWVPPRGDWPPPEPQP